MPPIKGLIQPTIPTTIPFQWADLSLDEHYLITNQGRSSVITLVDLEARTARSIALAPEAEITGGVALNHGWINRGLLAVHHSDHIAAHSFDPAAIGPLVAVASHSIASPKHDDPMMIHYAIRWNAVGDKIVATSRNNGGNRIFSLGANGELDDLGSIPNCTVLPNDLWTANGLLVPSPTPTATR